MLTQVKISDIRLDGGTQPREEIDYELVDQYAEHMEAGDKFPPIELYCDGSSWWLVNGFHRFFAAKKIGRENISSNVFSESKEAAQWDSYAANKEQDKAGKRRTNADKARAVKAALMHEKAKDMSDNDIAEHIGVSAMTIGRYRESIYNNVIDTDNSPTHEPTTRKVTRGEKTYDMKVNNIGKKKVAPVDAFAVDETNNGSPLPTNDEPIHHEPIGFEYANNAIQLLSEIPRDDPERRQALQSVIKWIINDKQKQG